MNNRKRRIIIGAYYIITAIVGVPAVAIFMETLKSIFGLIMD